MLRTLLLAAALVSMAACASTPPPYAPAASATGAGYSETQIETGRYFVTYRAGGPADAALVQDYVLLRAAELTLQNGREWFWVDRRSLDEASSEASGPRIGVGVGAGSYGGHTSGGVGVGLSFPIGGQSGPRAQSATLEIRFGEGPKPDAANAYDARSTAASLRARISAPR